MKFLPTLYSRTSTGAIQQWTVEIENDRYRTIYGQTDGKHVTTEWTVAKPTNVGRANERSGEKQALAEARSTWKDKKSKGCWEDINDIDKSGFIEPMLAHNYKDYILNIDWKAGVFIQPKLDGNRCITEINGMQSRNGKPINSCPHIYRKLKRLFAKYPNLVLDGELYADKFANDFNHLSSIIRKSKPTENDLMESDALVQYWIYDIVDPTVNFEGRSALIKKLFTEFQLDASFVCVETVKVYSPEDATTWYEKWIAMGMEGQMVRANTGYHPGRCSDLLKRKEFQDREYPILDICEGEGNKTGMAGYMIMQNDDGETFRSNIKGPWPYLRELLRDKAKYIGRLGTVQFFNLTPEKKVPRFPYVIKIRDDFDLGVKSK